MMMSNQKGEKKMMSNQKGEKKMTKWTKEEMSFVFQTLNAGPESTVVKDAPTTEIVEFLIENWGIHQPQKEDYRTVDEMVEAYKWSAEQGVLFRIGYERVRHALEFLDCCEAHGWTSEEIEEMAKGEGN
jgi:hypothetical protein